MAQQNDFDILTFSETWFNSSVSNPTAHLDDYSVYGLDRSGKNGGGVCAYLKTNFKLKTFKASTD